MPARAMSGRVCGAWRLFCVVMATLARPEAQPPNGAGDVRVEARLDGSVAGLPPDHEGTVLLTGSTVLARHSCRWNATDWTLFGRRGRGMGAGGDGKPCLLDFSALGRTLVLGGESPSGGDADAGGGGGAGQGAAEAGAAEPPSVKLLIGIMSGCCDDKFYRRRDAIRRTWAASLAAARPGVEADIGYRFIIGRPPGSPVGSDARTAAKAAAAAAAAGAKGAYVMPDADWSDMLHVPVEDTYKSMLLKLLHFVDWAVTSANFVFLMKADDDTLLSLHSLRRVVKQWADTPSRTSRLYHGHLWTGPPMRVRGGRDAEQHKNMLPSERYPLPLLPPYAHGAAYVVSRDIALYLAQNEAVLLPGLLSGAGSDACGFGCRLPGLDAAGEAALDAAASVGGARASAGSVEDMQLGLWLHALGIEGRHDHRFSDHIHCHSSTIALFDVTPELMLEVWKWRGEGDGAAPTRSLCSPSVHRAAISTHRRRLARMPSGVTNYNSIAYHQVLLREYTAAIETFRSALSVDPGYSIARANLNYLTQRMRAGCDNTCEAELHAAFDGGIIDAAKSISLPFFAEFANPVYDAFEYIYSDESDVRVDARQDPVHGAGGGGGGGGTAG